jgi:hypothetical protein
VTEEEAKQIDGLAEALDPAPVNRGEAETLLDRFPWAQPVGTVTSVIVTTPVEIPVLPSR